MTRCTPCHRYQISGVPAAHPNGAMQLSTPLQALPSLQIGGTPGTQPVEALQDSGRCRRRCRCTAAPSPGRSRWGAIQLSEPLQALPSSQIGGAPGTQPVEALQDSRPLQIVTVGSTAAACRATQPVAATQPSTPLQAFPSLAQRLAARFTETGHAVAGLEAVALVAIVARWQHSIRHAPVAALQVSSAVARCCRRCRRAECPPSRRPSRGCRSPDRRRRCCSRSSPECLRRNP